MRSAFQDTHIHTHIYTCSSEQIMLCDKEEYKHRVKGLVNIGRPCEAFCKGTGKR